ncbi:hypothetical protein [Duffyella gerundensis]|uniref:hypothetical protein n=1 Tax=Duffyella gerundensis TaxID=1619313 RepID=UPI0021F6B626|nr:hypothetical protein [Duffyella gerundensis]
MFGESSNTLTITFTESETEFYIKEAQIDLLESELAARKGELIYSGKSPFSDDEDDSSTIVEDHSAYYVHTDKLNPACVIVCDVPSNQLYRLRRTESIVELEEKIELRNGAYLNDLHLRDGMEED